MRLASRWGGVLVGLVLAGHLAPARAAGNPTFDLELLQLDPSAKGSLAVGSGRVLKKGRLRLALAAGYERLPLVVTTPSGSPGALLSDRLMATVVGAFGLTQRLELSAQIPMIAYQTGDELRDYGLAPVDSAGLANPTVAVRGAILSRRMGDPIDLVGGIGLGLPFGSPSALGGAGLAGTSLTPAVAASRFLGPVYTSASVSALVVATEPILSQRIGSRFDFGLSGVLAKVAFQPELDLRASVPLVAGLGSGFEVLVGARHDLVNSRFQLFALAGGGFGGLPGQPVFRALVGVSWLPELASDVPPKVIIRHELRILPEPCPPPPPPPPAKPCPEPKPCPPPPKALPDADHDLIPDAFDACPTQPGPLENDGCPMLDSDGDGVPDLVDDCPTVKGVAGNHGCPASQPQSVTIVRERAGHARSRFLLATPVAFARRSAAVPVAAGPELEQLAQVIAAHPELTRLEVQVTAFDARAPARNQALSARRARAIAVFLERHGVAKDRLSWKGLGGQELNRSASATGAPEFGEVQVVSIAEAPPPAPRPPPPPVPALAVPAPAKESR